MNVSQQITALFARHGTPPEDHRLTVSLLVLVATQQERLLSTQQELQSEANNLATAVTNLASGIASLAAKASAPQATQVVDQTTLDSVVASLNAVSGQVANLISQIQAALTPPAPPAPNPTPAPSPPAG